MSGFWQTFLKDISCLLVYNVHHLAITAKFKDVAVRGIRVQSGFASVHYFWYEGFLSSWENIIGFCNIDKMEADSGHILVLEVDILTFW